MRVSRFMEHAIAGIVGAADVVAVRAVVAELEGVVVQVRDVVLATVATGHALEGKVAVAPGWIGRVAVGAGALVAADGFGDELGAEVGVAIVDGNRLHGDFLGLRAIGVEVGPLLTVDIDVNVVSPP